ncbi:MAG: hypothetical protein C5B52_07395 [Bacteroidetes bacterium]|nr:MAG: hypothetical protein C5B52_07395 [Bacteroidota bacterium]
MTLNASYFIDYYGLQAHPEGGYYKENYRSEEMINEECLPIRFRESRCFSTAIYYLLEAGQVSAFHRIKSDELWHFYHGSPLNIYVIFENGEFELIRLGNSPGKGEVFQANVPAGSWFAAQPNDENGFSLVGCTVAPGFDYDDFEMADSEILLEKFPQHTALIEKFCQKSSV